VSDFGKLNLELGFLRASVLVKDLQDEVDAIPDGGLRLLQSFREIIDLLGFQEVVDDDDGNVQFFDERLNLLDFAFTDVGAVIGAMSALEYLNDGQTSIGRHEFLELFKTFQRFVFLGVGTDQIHEDRVWFLGHGFHNQEKYITSFADDVREQGSGTWRPGVENKKLELAPESFVDFLGLEKSILRGLGNTELENRLGRDLDGFARSRVATHASVTLLFDELADAWKVEFAVLFYFDEHHFDELFEHFASFFFADAPTLCEVGEHLSFGHFGHNKRALSN